jgi:hypothetical protein
LDKVDVIMGGWRAKRSPAMLSGHLGGEVDDGAGFGAVRLSWTTVAFALVRVIRRPHNGPLPVIF